MITFVLLRITDPNEIPSDGFLLYSDLQNDSVRLSGLGGGESSGKDKGSSFVFESH